MQPEKRKHSAEFKVKILKEHLEQQVPVVNSASNIIYIRI